MSNYRAPIRTVQSNWLTGEVDPMSFMRVDSKGYVAGAKALRNMLVRSTGATERRPGMLTKADMGTVRRRLIEFEFDANEKYVCAFGAAELDIYNAAGVKVANLATPWNATTVWEINLVQKGDVMIIVHTTTQMRRLRRTGLSSFVLETIYFSADPGESVYNHPQIKYQPAGVYMAFSVPAGGAGVLSCNSGILTSAWNGERVRIYDKEIYISAVTDSQHANATAMQPIRERLAVAPYRATLGSGVVEVTHVQHGLLTGSTVTFNGSGSLFNIAAASLNGAHAITVVDEDHYWFSQGTAADTSGDGGGGGVTAETPNFTTRWTEQVFSTRHGWPGAVTLHENRLWLGGNKDLPTFLSGSAVGDYYDHNVRDGFDDESVQGLISTLSRIVHLVSAKQLQIFCESSEAIVSTQDGEPITPGSLKVVNQTSYGSSPNVRPRVFDGATIFVQRSGKNIRELIYDFNTDSHVASPISVLASHIINHPNDVATLLGTNTRPEQYAFYVNADGTVACFHSIRNEAMAAWTHFTCGGDGVFDSVCTIGTSVFFSVKRGANYYLDRLELDATNIWLDSAVQLTGINTVFNAGLAYANKTVEVMAGGYLIGSYPCDAAGAFMLPFVCTNPIVGYDYGVEVTPLAYDISMTDGPGTGEKRRIVSSTIHYHQSVSAAVNGIEQLGFTIGQDPSLPPVKVSAKKRVRMLGYDRDPQWTVTQPNPGPLILLGHAMEISI